MKKSLVALAVLAASGATMAQSSVTLYGIADIWLGSVKVENAAGSVTKTLENSGGVNGSRWGMKGAEDLGGGLKAVFDLQSGFNLDNGASGQGGLLFGRQAWVGLSGGFGTVKFGRLGTPYYDIDGSSDAAFDSALSAQAVAFRSYVGADTSLAPSNYSARFDNAVRYDSPNLSGFSASIEYGLTENKTTTVDAGANSSLSLAYAAGPFAAQLGYQSQKATGAAIEIKNTRLGASYNLGVATVKASYGKADNVKPTSAGVNTSGAQATEYQIGADFPVSAALTLSGNMAKSKDNATAGDAERTAFGLAAAYTLSKRTFLYGGYVGGKETKPATVDTKISALVVGVQHRF